MGEVHSVPVRGRPRTRTFMGTILLPYFMRSMSVTTQV